MGMFAHGAAYGSSSASASWPPSSAGMMGDLDCGGGDDLFAISRQMGYADGGGSGSAAMSSQQQQFYYSCQPGERRAVHACMFCHSISMDRCLVFIEVPWSSWALQLRGGFFEFGSALHARHHEIIIISHSITSGVRDP
jgi:hypothetical protein